MTARGLGVCPQLSPKGKLDGVGRKNMRYFEPLQGTESGGLRGADRANGTYTGPEWERTHEPVLRVRMM